MVVRALEGFGLSLECERGPNAGTSSGGETRAQVCVVVQALDPIGDRGWTLRLHEDSSLKVHDLFRDAADTRRDYGYPGRHCFQRTERKPLLARSEDENAPPRDCVVRSPVPEHRQ